eukprot:6214829-Pleurochrysis_carterae.AAC.5
MESQSTASTRPDACTRWRMHARRTSGRATTLPAAACRRAWRYRCAHVGGTAMAGDSACAGVGRVVHTDSCALGEGVHLSEPQPAKASLESRKCLREERTTACADCPCVCTAAACRRAPRDRARSAAAESAALASRRGAFANDASTGELIATASWTTHAKRCSAAHGDTSQSSGDIQMGSEGNTGARIWRRVAGFGISTTPPPPNTHNLSFVFRAGERRSLACGRVEAAAARLSAWRREHARKGHATFASGAAHTLRETAPSERRT